MLARNSEQRRKVPRARLGINPSLPSFEKNLTHRRRKPEILDLESRNLPEPSMTSIRLGHVYDRGRGGGRDLSRFEADRREETATTRPIAGRNYFRGGRGRAKHDRGSLRDDPMIERNTIIPLTVNSLLERHTRGDRTISAREISLSLSLSCGRAHSSRPFGLF